MFCYHCGTRLTGTATTPSVTAPPVAPVAPPPVVTPLPVPPEPAAPVALAPVAPVAPVEAVAPVAPVLPVTPAPVVPPAPAPSAGTGQPRLELAGSGNVINLPNKDEILIGREDPLSDPPIFPDVDLTPYGGEEGGVSRRHARILRRDNDYLVEDLQSTNYTKLNGQRLAPRQPALLVDGSRVDFGKVSVIFRR
jgi:hypothetical protein